MRFSNTNILQLIKCVLGHKIFSLIKRLRVEKLQITVQCTANEISIVREPPALKISKCYTPYLSFVLRLKENRETNPSSVDRRASYGARVIPIVKGQSTFAFSENCW